jgi:hypothetical protein
LMSLIEAAAVRHCTVCTSSYAYVLLKSTHLEFSPFNISHLNNPHSKSLTFL